MDGRILNAAGTVAVESALGFSGEDILRDIEALRRELDGTFGIPVRLLSSEQLRENQEAEARAEELLARFLTAGERAALDRIGVIPVLGGETGDLYLVKRARQHNLLRYRNERVYRRWLWFLPPKVEVIPRRGCVTCIRGEPLADLLLSILVGLRYAESKVDDMAFWFTGMTLKRGDDMDRWLNGHVERALEPGLRALAECRCESPKMFEAVARAAEASGGLV